jgi:hypothetical protein
MGFCEHIQKNHMIDDQPPMFSYELGLILAPQPIQEREGETLNIYEAMIDEVVASDV